MALRNIGKEPVEVKAGMRIAQVAFLNHYDGDLRLISDALPITTQRGTYQWVWEHRNFLTFFYLK